MHDDLEHRFSAWVASKRFVVAGPALNWPLPLRRGADPKGWFLTPHDPGVLRSLPSAPGRLRRLLAAVLAIAARLRRPARRGR